MQIKVKTNFTSASKSEIHLVKVHKQHFQNIGILTEEEFMFWFKLESLSVS